MDKFINDYKIDEYNKAKTEEVRQATANGLEMVLDVVTREEIKEALQKYENIFKGKINPEELYKRAYMDILFRHQLGFQILNDPARYKE